MNGQAKGSFPDCFSGGSCFPKDRTLGFKLAVCGLAMGELGRIVERL